MTLVFPMKPLFLFLACALLGCGSESEPAGPTEPDDLCTREWQACIRYGYSDGPRDGACRAYADAPDAFVCCAGCWDRMAQYCQPGDVLGKCGVGGEDCAAEKCAAP